MMKWIYEWGNTTASLNQQCVKANAGMRWKCMFAQETAPFNNFRMLSLQPRFDTWQIDHILIPNSDDEQLEISEYGENLTRAFVENYIETSEEHFGFLDSCSHHCGSWNTFTIDGMNASELSYHVYMGNVFENLWFQNSSYPCLDCCENNIDKGCEEQMQQILHIDEPEGIDDVMINDRYAGYEHHILAFIAISIAFCSFMIGVCIRRQLVMSQTNRIRNVDK